MKKKITSPEFAAAAIIARVSPDRAAVARSVLVDGMTYSAAVEPYGWTRQAAYVPVRAIQSSLERYKNARKAEQAEQARLDALPLERSSVEARKSEQPAAGALPPEAAPF